MDDEQSHILIVHESLGIVIAMNEENTIITQASKIADKICVPFVRIRSCGLSMSD